ncbi:MAG TPA: TonB-dependent receptor [Steroidobacteraceae bacterium]|nr:TonB-dependent receptor [Steroidobacteraceae bacterium]
MSTRNLVIRRESRFCAAAGALCLALAWHAPALAQTAPQAETQGATRQGSSDLEEIVVTATRRSEALSKVPISVTALNQDSMDARGIKDFQDIARFTPGIAIDNSGTNAISIRGISSSGGAGTTGIYIDDTPIQMRAVGFNPDDTLPKTFDLDRVEVLRGPQGTLFGAGSEGGTVRYILTAPKLHGSSTYLRSELAFTEGGQPSYELGVAHGAALIDGTLGVRASAWYREDGGWIDRVDPSSPASNPTVTERAANHASSWVLRLAAAWQASDRLLVTPSIIYQNSKKHDESTYWPAYSNPASGHFNNATPELMPVPDKYYLPALKLEYNLAHSQIIANTSYFSRDEQSSYQGTVYDLAYYQSLGWPDNPNNAGYFTCADGSNAPCSWYPLIDGNGIHLPPGFENYQTPNLMTNSQRTWTQEVRWQSTDDSSRWRWTLGAFWQQAKEGSLEQLRDPRINELFQYLYALNAIDIYGDYYSCPGQVGTYTAIPACDVYYNDQHTIDRQFAVFGELSYALTDRLRLTVGERVARTSFSLTQYADGVENYGPSNPLPASHTETPNTPKVNVAYQMDGDNLFYATYAKGFRVGGGNPQLPAFCDADLDNNGFPDGAPPAYQSDSTQSYELGSKNAFGPAFKIATSVYYIRWQNIQQSVYIGGGCGLQFTGNLGQAVAKGFDLQAEFAVGPMKFELATGYTDARYTKATSLQSPFCPSASTNPCKPLANVGDAISGEAAIEQSPGLGSPWTAALGAQYDFKAAGHAAFVRVDYQYEGRNNWLSTLQDPNSTQYNPDTYTLPSTEFLQLRGGVTLGNWSLAAFIDNLTNSHTVTNYQLGQADSYNPNGTPSEQQNQYTFRPRTFGINATLRL